MAPPGISADERKEMRKGNAQRERGVRTGVTRPNSPHSPPSEQIALRPVDSPRTVDNSVTRSVSSAPPARQPPSATAA